jgi:hypothetical protein
MSEPSIAIHAWGLQVDAVGPYGIGAVIALATLLLIGRWAKLL